VVSFSLAANATFEDIARTFGELSNQRYGDPVAIDVTLAGSARVLVQYPGDSSANRILRRLGATSDGRHV
jgi:hypothetical protein